MPVAFHNSPNYVYNFLIKELPRQFEGELESFGKNKENWKTFQFQWEKKNEDKDGNENIIKISQKIKFFNGERFMASSLSNFCC